MDEETTLVEFTAHEIVFLTDNIQVGDVNVGDPDHPYTIEPIARALLLKLGGVFLQVLTTTGVKEDEARGVNLTEKECWLIKSRVRVGDLGLGAKPVGVGILLKILTTLMKFNPGKPGVLITDALEEIPVCEETGESYPEALQRKKARGREKRHVRTTDDPDDEAGYGARP